MDTFDSIFSRAAQRKGGEAVLETLLTKPKTKAGLARLQDADMLAQMTKCVFRSGFVWKVIERKWSGFEAAFHEFDVTGCAMLSDEELSRGLRENAEYVGLATVANRLMSCKATVF